MSAAAWPAVPLGEVLRQRKEFILIDDLATYKRPRVQLHAKGIVLRDTVKGAEIKTKNQQVCRADEFLVAEIDAKMGGFGIVPADLDGALVSSHYFLFCIDEERLDTKFLAFYSQTKTFRDQVEAQGSTNYAAIRPDDVLSYTMPLPALEEQRRIVSRIEAIAGKVNLAQALRMQSVEQVHNLARSLVVNNGQLTAMRELVRLRQHDVKVNPAEKYHFAGVYCFGNGVFRGQQKAGTDFAYKQLTRLKAGNFVFPKLMAWEGAFGIVPDDCDGLVVSPEFPVFEVDEDKVLPEVLDVYFKTPSVWPRVSSISTGTNVRRRRLNPQTFLDYKMPVPPREVQFKLRTVQKRVSLIKQLQSQTAGELDALMPAVLDKAFKGEL